MTNTVIRFGCGLLLAAAATIGAQASSPTEKIVCTDPANRSQWLSEARIREIFGDKNFSLVTHKVSRGGCYEFYAVHLDGSIVEAYYHPITGQAVRYNRVSGKADNIGYESRDSKIEAAKPQ